jgi:hypothetical protein
MAVAYNEQDKEHAQYVPVETYQQQAAAVTALQATCRELQLDVNAAMQYVAELRVALAEAPDPLDCDMNGPATWCKGCGEVVIAYDEDRDGPFPHAGDCWELKRRKLLAEGRGDTQ